MKPIGVIGNISRDAAIYPGGGRIEMFGGAALHIALAAAHAGLPAAPLSVIGTDLAWIASHPRLARLDLTHVKVIPGRSCAFRLSYDQAGMLTGTRASFGVAADLTGHARSTAGSHHVCQSAAARRPHRG